MAMPSGNEVEDLGGPLSRLLGLVSTLFLIVSLLLATNVISPGNIFETAAHKISPFYIISPIGQIQDDCIVESGPHLDSKHAYVIVRHVKFATKKAGKKASKAMEDAGKGARSNASELSAVTADSGGETTECGLEVNNGVMLDQVDKTSTYLSSESSIQKEAHDRGSRRDLSSPKFKLGNYNENMQNINTGGSRINPGHLRAQTSDRGLGSKNVTSDVEKRGKTNEDIVPAETNRYANRRQQIRGDNQGLSQDRSSQGPRRNENEVHLANDHQSHVQQNNRPLPRFSNGRLPQEPRRNERGGHIPLNGNQRQFQQMNGPAESAGNGAGNPAPTTKSVGIFSSRKPSTSESTKTNGASTSMPANPDFPKSKSYGIFSSARKESGDKSS
ncbi:hypothetical protein GUJ93_ZPchr0006g42915 [Zizania palustris]|uniref:Uncharacterized protein n=1 Tax=Zizania palustris TaxID=103762 RepID=A0A8J5SW13_ZIZPA|nr:hypothetical protein GUJ93_ZPchr0006g42915 [Zizania palustris]